MSRSLWVESALTGNQVVSPPLASPTASETSPSTMARAVMSRWSGNARTISRLVTSPFSSKLPADQPAALGAGVKRVAVAVHRHRADLGGEISRKTVWCVLVSSSPSEILDLRLAEDGDRRRRATGRRG